MKETATNQPFSFHVQGVFTADYLSLEEWKIPISAVDDIEQVLIKTAISEHPNQALNHILCEIYEENYPAAFAEIEECLSKNYTGGYLCGSKSIMDYAKEYCQQRL